MGWGMPCSSLSYLLSDVRMARAPRVCVCMPLLVAGLVVLARASEVLRRGVVPVARLQILDLDSYLHIDIASLLCLSLSLASLSHTPLSLLCLCRLLLPSPRPSSPTSISRTPRTKTEHFPQQRRRGVSGIQVRSFRLYGADMSATGAANPSWPFRPSLLLGIAPRAPHCSLIFIDTAHPYH